jgi:hypothetical protein
MFRITFVHSLRLTTLSANMNTDFYKKTYAIKQSILFDRMDLDERTQLLNLKLAGPMHNCSLIDLNEDDFKLLGAVAGQVAKYELINWVVYYPIYPSSAFDSLDRSCWKTGGKPAAAASVV